MDSSGITKRQARLIARFLSGEISDEEHKELLTWVNKNQANKQLFDFYCKAWSTEPETEVNFQTEENWQILSGKIAHYEASRRIVNNSLQVKPLFRIAAILLVTLGIAFGVYQIVTNNSTRISSDLATVKYYLPDSSIVWLNKSSAITFKQTFSSDTREVTLEGEAFFDVRRDTLRPFIIHTPLSQIEVLGTSFDVKAYPLASSEEVAVVTGTVNFGVKGKNEKLMLQPGDLGVLQKTNSSITKRMIANPNFLSWKTKEFVFENTPLAEVIDILNSSYTAQVIIKSPNSQWCRFTGTFKQAELSQILEVIGLALNLEVKDVNKNYVLTGAGCN